MQMLKLKYTNHYGEEIQFGENNLFINESDIHDYEWEYDVVNKKVVNFNNPTMKYTMEVFATGEERNNIANHLFEVINKDVLENEVGFITIGDYYLEGYFVAKANSKYSSGKIIKMTLNYVATKQWIKKTKYSFMPDQTTTEGDLDYPHDFPHDLKGTQINKQIINDGYMPCDFEIVFFGEQETPTITINGHDYQVFTHINANEYLVVNSLDKKIYKVLNDGTRENVFNRRNKESYIFEKIAVGKATVIRDTDSRLDITLIEQRSEPKWI
jgi:hypothetical protein